MKQAIVLAALILSVALSSCSYKDDFYGDFIMGGTQVEIDGRFTKGTKVRIPARLYNLPVTSIGKRAFYRYELTSVRIPGSVTYICDEAFRHNQLTSVHIPGNVSYIEAGAFQDNKLTNVSVPRGTSVHPKAFDEWVTVTRRWW